MSAAVSSVFVCQYDIENFNGDVTNLFAKFKNRTNPSKAESDINAHCRPLECSLKAS